MPKYVVRYGVMRLLGVFGTRGRLSLTRGMQVIARTSRGLEAAEVLCEADEHALESLKNPESGQVLRKMTDEDRSERDHIRSQVGDEFAACQRHIEQLGLDMDLVDVEHIFGGERIVVYYLAEDRVDFRELVRVLAGEFQTRIEMRQIGVRDEARILADYGDCGKPVCCNTHLSEMPPVSMKMAKIQKATLDPTKISGRCGRLKCCLRYEYDTYVEMKQELPPVGSDCVTNIGRGLVLNQAILAGQVLMQMEDGRRVLVDGDDVLTILKRGKGSSGRKKKPKANFDAEESGTRAEPRNPNENDA